MKTSFGTFFYRLLSLDLELHQEIVRFQTVMTRDQTRTEGE